MLKLAKWTLGVTVSVTLEIASKPKLGAGFGGWRRIFFRPRGDAKQNAVKKPLKCGFFSSINHLRQQCPALQKGAVIA